MYIFSVSIRLKTLVNKPLNLFLSLLIVLLVYKKGKYEIGCQYKYESYTYFKKCPIFLVKYFISLLSDKSECQAGL